jgi:hypothetical protein
MMVTLLGREVLIGLIGRPLVDVAALVATVKLVCPAVTKKQRREVNCE